MADFGGSGAIRRQTYAWAGRGKAGSGIKAANFVVKRRMGGGDGVAFA
jgi:hypothetical protein